MKILIIIPAYNESENISGLLDLLTAKMPQADLLVINDASTDNTAELVNQKGIKQIDLPINLGIGGAVQTGYKYALINDYDIAVQVDGDGQHNPDYIKNLVAEIIENRFDMVIGSRFIENKGFRSSFLRRIGIKYFCGLIFILSGKKVTDPTSGFRACNKKTILEFANNYPGDYPEPESLVLAFRKGFKVKEVPVEMNERKGGKSSIRSFRTIYYMIKLSLAIFINTFKNK